MNKRIPKNLKLCWKNCKKCSDRWWEQANHEEPEDHVAGTQTKKCVGWRMFDN
jgi:hypothetical protein